MDYIETQHYTMGNTPYRDWLFEFTKFKNFTPYKDKTDDEQTFSKRRSSRWYNIERKERIYENVIKWLKMLQKIWWKLIDKIDFVDKRPRDIKHRTDLYIKKNDSRPDYSFEWQDEYDLLKNLYTFLWKCIIGNENLIPKLLSNEK